MHAANNDLWTKVIYPKQCFHDVDKTLFSAFELREKRPRCFKESRAADERLLTISNMHDYTVENHYRCRRQYKIIYNH